ncbi:thioredoxin domain-containing protein [Stakelama marina]|uniref:Thioredoxin domain-containing protein n=1 Tax=Stakelama marina TaxID=2826939 RepID=A0A8T4IG61_9SPHN|nr:thioredoxin domain-containing protein [Stakelama marina]MBR0552864.1 thioredoxin domain-containing protein [Stakelama marina]
MRLAFLAIPLLILAACSGDGGASAGNSAAPVAGAQAPAGKQWHEVVSTKDVGVHVMGNPNAPIKLVEYGSRGCPVCGAFAREGYDPLIKNYIDTGKVSLEFHEYMVHGAPDLAASLLGLCVPTSAYFPVLEQMYADQETLNGNLQKNYDALQPKLQGMKPAQALTALANAAGYIDFMKKRGLPEAKAQACLNDQAKAEKLTNAMQKAQEDDNVTSTPTFFINGDRINSTSWSGLKAALVAHGA